MNGLEAEQEELILNRFQKQRVVETTPHYRKYVLKDIYGGERAEIKIQYQGVVKPTVLH